MYYTENKEEKMRFVEGSGSYDYNTVLYLLCRSEIKRKRGEQGNTELLMMTVVNGREIGRDLYPEYNRRQHNRKCANNGKHLPLTRHPKHNNDDLRNFLLSSFPLTCFCTFHNNSVPLYIFPYLLHGTFSFINSFSLDVS